MTTEQANNILIDLFVLSSTDGRIKDQKIFTSFEAANRYMENANPTLKEKYETDKATGTKRTILNQWECKAVSGCKVGDQYNILAPVEVSTWEERFDTLQVLNSGDLSNLSPEKIKFLTEMLMAE